MDLGLILSVIWPYLAALYILDCVLVVRGGRLLFTGTPSGGFTVRGPGLRLAGLLPWSWSILATAEPLILSVSGVYARIDPDAASLRPGRPEDFEFIPWDAVGEVRSDGKKVRMGRGITMAFSTGIEADGQRDRILKLRDMPPGKRAHALMDILAASSDTEALKGGLEAARDLSSGLVGISTGLFLWVMAAVPLSLLLRPPTTVLWAELALFLGGWLAVAILWWRAHRALFPYASWDRLEETLVFLLFPASALHAPGKLTRRLLASFDSMALIAALVPSVAGEAIKREWIRFTASASSGGSEDFSRAWEMRARALERLAGRAGVELPAEARPPDRKGEGEAVCPLCGAGYRGGVAACADCGVALGVRNLSS